MCTLIFFQRFITLQNSEDLISEVHFTSSLKHIRKIPPNYEEMRNEVLVYEQKPLEIDDFNEAEEKEIKERVGKRKLKRTEVAENKLLKKKKKKRKKEKENKNKADIF